MSFEPDRNVVDYNQLFAATTMMPSHVIADELGIDVTGALMRNDLPVIGRIARLVSLGPEARPPSVLGDCLSRQTSLRAARPYPSARRETYP